jgi:predicted transcriptional regulator
MKPFCEIIVTDILPAMRAIVAKELIEEYGLNQTQVSKKLGITQPAVSQYKSELRGRGVKILYSDKKIMCSIKNLSKKIASDEIDLKKIHQNFCKICLKIRKEKIICKLHTEAYPSLSRCNLCFK